MSTELCDQRLFDIARSSQTKREESRNQLRHHDTLRWFEVRQHRMQRRSRGASVGRARNQPNCDCRTDPVDAKIVFAVNDVNVSES